MEMDQTHLKDMGIKKVGDRVRIGSQAKQLRNKEYKKASRRTSNRVSLDTKRFNVCSHPIAITRHTRQRSVHSTFLWLASTPTLGAFDSGQLAIRQTHVQTNYECRP